MALAIDQPLRVGDLVKVEDFVGTVEDIGLRSTRFRTLDRTVVSIPNGKLADQRLESFQLRDRMRLATTVGLTYATTRQQMQAVLAGFERVLRSHPRIWADAVIVKFKEFGSSSLDIEVMAWFEVPTWDRVPGVPPGRAARVHAGGRRSRLELRLPHTDHPSRARRVDAESS